MAPVTLGYWRARGLGNPIRYLLEHAGVEYEEKVYVCGGPPDFPRDEWIKDKAENPMGLDFPNLPYLLDGDIKLTQSHVIMRYLARKHNLAGDNETERTRADLLATQVFDYIMQAVRVIYDPNFLNLKDDYVKTLSEKFELLAKFLGSRKFAVGDKVSYADFVLYEFIEAQKLFKQDMKDFPVLEEYHKRVQAVKGVVNYFKSPKAIKFPFNGPTARIGGDFSEQLLKQ